MWQDVGYGIKNVWSNWQRGKNDPVLDWPQLKDRRVVFTHLSRTSIFLAYKMLGLSPGDEVLFPSYNCGSEVDPLLWCNAKIVFYRIDAQAKIDIADLQNRVTPKTRAVYVTHYFGWPHALRDLAQWCKTNNLSLIEDCALTPLSEGPDGPVGHLGDAAVYCLWKIFPVPDGGVLSLPLENRAIFGMFRRPDPRAIFRRMKPFFFVQANKSQLLGPFYRFLKETRGIVRPKMGGTSEVAETSGHPMMHESYYFDPAIRDWGLSQLSKGMMMWANTRQIIDVRRRNYRLLQESIRDLPRVKILFNDLPEGVCPLVFPILVTHRAAWLQSLNKRDIHPIPWWMGYNADLSWEDFPEAVYLKNSLLAFHIDQHMDENRIRHIAAGIIAAALENR
jgi:perosamine synthetase